MANSAKQAPPNGGPLGFEAKLRAAAQLEPDVHSFQKAANGGWQPPLLELNNRRR